MKKYLWMMTAALFCVAGCVPEQYILRHDPEALTPIRIAAVLPLTGENRVFAEQMLDGLRFAEMEMNSKRGINGRSVELQFFDSAGTAGGALTAVEDAVSWGAAGMIAGYSSDEVTAVINYASTYRLPTVIPLATSDYHISVSPFVYRNSYTDKQQADMLASYLFYWRKVMRLGIFIDISDSNAEYSRSVARDTAQTMTDIGGEVVKTLLLENGEVTDGMIREMLMANPMAILIPTGGRKAAIILRKLRDAGFSGIICGPDSWDDDFIAALAGCEPGDCLFTAFFSDSNQSEEFQQFKTGFRKHFFHNPGACETQSYDALKFLGIGLSTAGTLPDFDRNWRTIRNHQGAAALYTMLPKGEIDRTIYLNTIGVSRFNGKLIPFARLSAKFQYSKLQEYRSSYYTEE